jgi:hypothetical protein
VTFGKTLLVNTAYIKDGHHLNQEDGRVRCIISDGQTRVSRGHALKRHAWNVMDSVKLQNKLGNEHFEQDVIKQCTLHTDGPAARRESVNVSPFMKHLPEVPLQARNPLLRQHCQR